MAETRWTSTDGDVEHESPEGPMLLVGTRKGLWLVGADATRSRWSVAGPAFLGHVVHHAVVDPRDRRTLLVAARTGHLGPTVLRSTDVGRSFVEATRPPAFASGDLLGRALRAVFWLTPGHADEPGAWYAGGIPQGLFRSEDGGDTWAPVPGWNDHPRWADWAEWPEEGTPDGSMLHSVNVDPRDPRHLYLGLSGGGVFESVDGGGDWAPLNAGSVATFLPDPEPEYGHDPHCVRLHPLRPDRLYQQNHCGIYRMERTDGRWVRIGDNMPGDVGDIGFPIELHPRDPDTVWVFPMDGTDVWPRTSPDGRPAVYVTRDAGEQWRRLDRGLPERGWLTVKRQAMSVDAGDPVGVYFGTTGGEVWASRDEGGEWSCVLRHLPEVYSVEVADPTERD
ncbi:MAG: glycosyl hydrolase [Actinobacteria bacterium]|nr:glycosyl hydrolase [Actinomycetota bacterium]